MPRATQSSTSSTSPRPKARTSARPRSAVLSALPYRVERAAGAVAGGAGFMLGGLTPGDVSIAQVLRVDLRTGQARRVATLPVAEHDAAATSLNGVIYLFGGSGASGALVQRFDPTSDTVSTIGHLPRALSDLSAVTVNNTMYVLGGFDNVRARGEVMATTDGKTFSTIATLPSGVRYAAVAAAGSKILVAGGQTDSAAATREVFEVDTTAGRVRLLATLPVPVAHASMMTFGSDAFVIGGRDASGRPTHRVWRVHIPDGSVTAAPSLAVPLADATLLLTAPGNALLAGGATGSSASGGETSKELFFRAP